MSQFPAETPKPFEHGNIIMKRRRGGQPGNTNALKHGRYLAGYRFRNAAQVEVRIPDINELIETIRGSIQVTYEVSLNANNLVESTKALHALSMAVNGLIRLINLSKTSGKSSLTPYLEEFSSETYKPLLAKKSCVFTQTLP